MHNIGSASPLPVIHVTHLNKEKSPNYPCTHYGNYLCTSHLLFLVEFKKEWQNCMYTAIYIGNHEQDFFPAPHMFLLVFYGVLYIQLCRKLQWKSWKIQIQSSSLPTTCMPAALNGGPWTPRGCMNSISHKAKILASTENILFTILTIMRYI
jgi:hypothetical protein